MNPPNVLLLLPSELICEIVSRLDCFSVAALLKAYPELHHFAVLITDHTDTPHFFDIPGLQRRLTTVSNHHRAQTTGSKIGTGYIQLFEVTSPREIGLLQQETHNPRTDNERVPVDCFDKGSFVYIRMNTLKKTSRLNIEAKRLSMFLERRGANYHIDETPLGELNLWNAPVDCTMHFPAITKDHLFCNIDELSGTFSCLKLLRLEQVWVVYDMTINTLEELIISFKDGKQGSPAIRNCEFPELNKLAILFEESVPIIRGVKTENLKSFEMYDRRSLDQFYPPYQADERSIMNIFSGFFDLSFTQSCSQITLSGVPDDVLAHVKFDNAEYFHWRRFCKPSKHGCVESITAGSLVTLSIHNVVPDTSLPVFEVTGRLFPLEYLSIVNHAPNFELVKFLNSAAFKHLKSIYVNMDVNDYHFKSYTVPDVPIVTIANNSGSKLRSLVCYGCESPVSQKVAYPTYKAFGCLKVMEIQLLSGVLAKDKWFSKTSVDRKLPILAPTLECLWLSERSSAVSQNSWKGGRIVFSGFYDGLTRIRTGPFPFSEFHIKETDQKLLTDGKENTYATWRYNDDTGLFDEEEIS